MSCTAIKTAPALSSAFKGTLTLRSDPPLTIYDPLDPDLSSRLLHPDILRQILLHLPHSTLARLLRVSKDIYSVAGPILYSSISYLPDRYGPTPLDGLNTPVPRPPRRLSYVPNEDHHDDLPCYSNNKRALLMYTKNLRIGYHHHETPHTHTQSHTQTHAQIHPSQSSPRTTLDAGIDMPNLRVIHISGERSCVSKSCPYLTRAKPRTVIINKIDLFSGSPRWTHPFVLPCHSTTQKAIYLVTSPFFLRSDKMQGLDPLSFRVGSSTFIFGLREYELEWKDTARKMSDSDPHSALVGHLVSLLLGCLGGIRNTESEVLFVGLELVAAHLRPRAELPSNRPEDLVEQFREAVLQEARRRWAMSGITGEMEFEEALSRCRFMSMREYVVKEMKDDELDMTKLESWANCWEHVVASSGVDVAGP